MRKLIGDDLLVSKIPIEFSMNWTPLVRITTFFSCLEAYKLSLHSCTHVSEHNINQMRSIASLPCAIQNMIMVVIRIKVIGWFIIAVIPHDRDTFVQSGFVVLEILKEALDCTHICLRLKADVLKSDCFAIFCFHSHAGNIILQIKSL